MERSTVGMHLNINFSECRPQYGKKGIRDLENVNK